MSNTLEIPKHAYDKYFRFMGVERVEMPVINFEGKYYKFLTSPTILVENNQYNNDIVTIIKTYESEFDITNKLMQYEFICGEIALYKLKIDKYLDLIKLYQNFATTELLVMVCNNMIRKINKKIDIKENERKMILENIEL